MNIKYDITILFLEWGGGGEVVGDKQGKSGLRKRKRKKKAAVSVK